MSEKPKLKRLRDRKAKTLQGGESRPRLINALEMLQNKRDSNPSKKHGNIPL